MNGIVLIKLSDGTDLVRLNGTRFTTAVQVLVSVYRVFEGSETKKEVKNDLLSCLALLTVGSCNQIFESLV